MKRKAIAVAVLALSQTAAVLVGQQEKPKAQIEGMVLRAANGDPIAGARVSLTRVNTTTGGALPSAAVVSASFSTAGAPGLPPSAQGRGIASPPAPPPPPAIPTVTSDNEGRFTIPNLDAGAYRLQVIGNGYVRQEYGQRVFPGQGAILTLTDGQVMKDIAVRLTFTGNVSGRIRDEYGRPAVGVPVQLLKASYNMNGDRVFQSAGSSRTNDRGEYRLYWVTPGRYYVAAGSTAGPRGGAPFAIGGGSVSPNDPGDNYVFTYYPGVTDVGAAAGIDVTSGSEIGIDFPVSKQDLYYVRGVVVDSRTSRAPASISVSLSYSSLTGGGGVFSMNTPYDAAKGTFEIRDVVPGAYVLTVTSEGTAARMPIDVSGNIENLPVVLSGTFAVSGRLTIDGQLEPSGPDQFRVQLRPAGNVVGAMPSPPQVSPDGTFTFENVVAGVYRVGITPPRSGGDYYIKDARFDRNDALNQPLTLSADTRSDATLEIVVSPNVGHVEGTVTDERQQPVAGVQAVLIPEDKRDRPELFKAATTDQSGRFVIRAVTPGAYKLFAWEALENFGYFDLDFVKTHESRGRPIQVAESTVANADIKVIAAEP